MTEEKAKAKLCPYLLSQPENPISRKRCRTKECMAWEQFPSPYDDEGDCRLLNKEL